MNFGEKLKQIRTDKGLTQPQFAEAIGIEQSYLSKLENDKSVPSADMFTTILNGLGMDAATFLKGVDDEVLTTTLRHIPAVSQFKTHTVAVQVHNSKQWLFGSALAWILGFALMLAANDGIFFSNKLYKYISPGVILSGEAENIFETHRDILNLRQTAKLISFEEFARLQAEFLANRSRPVTLELPVNRGTVFFEPAENGRRRFELIKTEYIQPPGNRVLQFLGATVMVCGFVGLFLDWRLRRLKNKRH
jgi:transcriptional regulator with XRE-family HTH domain